MNQEKRKVKYDRQVKMYEKNRYNPNLVSWRRSLIGSAYGKVLEVGVGVGANFPYYLSTIELTGVDLSSEMINSAKRESLRFQFQSNFINEDVDKLSFEANSFDCIVSTLTLCSYPNPVQTLKKFQKWCKKDGYILLMEHGLSSNRLLSITQKMIDPLYIKFSGCHCDRDIRKIANLSNLQIERLETYWSGILNVIWARPSK